MKQYSLLKGIGKGLTVFGLFAVGAALTLIALASPQLLDTSIWALIEQYLKPILGTLTLGSLLVMFQNFLKNRTPE